MEPFTYTITKIYNENHESIDIARHPRMLTYLSGLPKMSSGTMMRLKVFDKTKYLC